MISDFLSWYNDYYFPLKMLIKEQRGIYAFLSRKLINEYLLIHVDESSILQQCRPRTNINREKYLQFLLLFLTLHLALSEGLGRLILDHLSALGLEGVQLGLVGQFGYPAVSTQLELTKPAQTHRWTHTQSNKYESERVSF